MTSDESPAQTPPSTYASDETGLELTFAEHVEQRIRVIPVSSDHNRLRPELLRLSRLLDEWTPAPLNQRNPSIRILRLVDPTYTQVWTPEDRVGFERITEDHRRLVRRLFRAWGRERRKRDHISQELICELCTKRGRAGGEGDGGRPVDDGDATVRGPRPAPEPAAVISGTAGASGACELAEPVDGGAACGGDEGRRREGENEEDVEHGVNDEIEAAAREGGSAR